MITLDHKFYFRPSRRAFVKLIYALNLQQYQMQSEIISHVNVQGVHDMKNFIFSFERTSKSRKVAVNRFLTSPLVPEL